MLLFLVCVLPLFPQAEGTDDEVLSLKQIDILIEATAYNDALKELSKYIAAHPNDFDRAQKRIQHVLDARELYNKGAQSLVDLIQTADDDAKSEKLQRITELESSELDSTETVIEFTNLARRTVTLGEVLILYNRIMREGAQLVKKELYPEAAVKFEEGFSIKNETSDVVFDPENPDESGLGVLVSYESDITSPVRKSVNNIRSLIAGSLTSASFAARELECEKAYTEYMQAISAKNANLDACQKAFSKVKDAFSKYAALHNRIIEETRTLATAEAVAEERNPLLMGTSYISFYEKFILGDESNPDTGVIGAMEAYYNTRIEAMKDKTNAVVFSILNATLKALPENRIYTLYQNIDGEQKNVALSKQFAELGISLHSLYALESTVDGSTIGKKHSEYEHSMGFVHEYIEDLALAYTSAKQLAAEKQHPEKIDMTSRSKSVIAQNLSKLMRYEQIKADSRSYLSLVSDELARESAYFNSLSKHEKEIAELVELSGGRLKISTLSKRTTPGVRITDAPLDFRAQIDYFTSLNNQNLTEALAHADTLWGYIANAYSVLAKEDYDRYARLCDEVAFLLYGTADGEQNTEDDSFVAEFLKKYPSVAKERAELINTQISEKRQELAKERETLAGGAEYTDTNETYRMGTLRLERIIRNFDGLYARNYSVITTATTQIKQYENVLREAYAQYDKALAAYKKEDFDNANRAVDAASEGFAQALDIEFSTQIQTMREETLSALAHKIQSAEYEKVLREVFALKDRAATLYYSSNFDAAETTLSTAQARWSKVSAEPDNEIEDLLNIVRTIRNIESGRVLLLSDPHYPELSYSIDMAKQSFERGITLKNQGKFSEAEEAFNVSLRNIRNVQNVYPLNKEARLLTLRIQQEIDAEGFPRQFENQYNAAKMNQNLSERLADLEDLYAINPNYPGLSQEIYNLKDALGMFPKKVVKNDTKKAFNDKLARAKAAFTAAGSDETKLSNALQLANEAIALDRTNKEATRLKLDIQLKIGATATPILSQSDEKMYSEAGRLFNQRRFAEAKTLMDRLMTGVAAQKSRKVVDLYNRILKRL